MNPTKAIHSYRSESISIFCTLLWILISACIVHRADMISIPGSVFPSHAVSNLVAASSRDDIHREPVTDLTIDVDSTRETQSDTALLHDIKQRIQGINSSPNLLQQGYNSSGEDIFSWTRLDGRRVFTTEYSKDIVQVYASSVSGSSVVYLQNHQDRPISVSLRTTLPKGVFKGEKLTITDGSEFPQIHMQRLEGADITWKHALVKPFLLEPRQICIIRFTDSAYEARLANETLLNHLHTLANTNPELARKLRRILSEGDPYLSGLSNNHADKGIKKRLGCIHRLLLITSQAESLQHNNLERKTITNETGRKVMESINQLSASLSETSAVLLGLVPQIENDAFSPPVIVHSNQKNSLALASFHKHQNISTSVNVSLSNTGSVPVTLVKIGLDTSEIPDITQLEPADPSVFGTLRPGQTVRAVFQVHVPESNIDKLKLLRGDISYFAESAPAKLRPRLW